MNTGAIESLPFRQADPLLSNFRVRISSSCGWLLLAATPALANPSLNGQAGYVNMPSAVVDADGTLSVGYSYDEPYGAFWISSAILPSLQFTGRYVSAAGIPGFSNVPGQYGSQYGRYKDKVVDVKFQLWGEDGWRPALAVGATDLLGTQLFKGQYLVATKTFGAARNLEASVGYGRKRPDGVFAAARWTPTGAPRWSLLAEYDANNYRADYLATGTSAAERRPGPVLGVEYRWGWLGAQLARHRDHFSANVYASIPLSEREFIPKLFEPAPYRRPAGEQRVPVAQWRAEPAHRAALVRALAAQDFKNIRIETDGTTLELALSNNRISELGRAVGRAARTVLAHAPTETRAIHITYTRLEQPIATYEFVDLDKLQGYFDARVARDSLLQSVVVRYATPRDRLDDDQSAMLAGIDDGARMGVRVGQDGETVQFMADDREDNRVKISPKMGFFFNDPSGAFRYSIDAAANYDRRLGQGLYLNSALRLSLVETISGVTQPSNSALPHVRTDIAEYKRGNRLKLNRLMLNQYFNPAERVYGRVSAGLYEEMFRGFGGQLLYLPRNERWAADLSVDALQQRGYNGWFDGRDYRTVSALGALHYRLPLGMTVTARGGRFLARDQGVRVEFKRRFRSGVEVGAWFAKTNGKDITNPGTPANPYNDKGIFLSVPLNSMLPSDTQANAGFALSPWTRDVGQMVLSPGDLYDMVENPWRDMHAFDGLGDFGERKDERDTAPVARPQQPLRNPWPAFRMRLEQSQQSAPPLSGWIKGAGLAGGAVLASSLLDKPVDRYVARHENARLFNTWGNFGKNMPIALTATAGIAALLGDERMQNTGYIALQSVAASLGVSVAGKYVVGRARPVEGRGPWAQVGEGYRRSDAAFPSGHSAAAFAAVTPFAQEYDAPWLYGVAAISSMGRVAGRQHWVSDTVAGGLIGYTVGTLLWKGQRELRDEKGGTLAIVPGNRSLSVAWQGKY